MISQIAPPNNMARSRITSFGIPGIDQNRKSREVGSRFWRTTTTTSDTTTACRRPTGCDPTKRAARTKRDGVGLAWPSPCDSVGGELAEGSSTGPPGTGESRDTGSRRRLRCGRGRRPDAHMLPRSGRRQPPRSAGRHRRRSGWRAADRARRGPPAPRESLPCRTTEPPRRRVAAAGRSPCSRG